MPTLLRAELLKIRTTRLWWVMAICVVVLSAAYAVLPPIISLASSAAPFDSPQSVLSIYHGGNALARVLALVLGVTVVGVEYRYNTMLGTYLGTPRRVKVMFAKGAAAACFGAAYGLLSLLAGLAVATPFLIVNEASFFLDRSATWLSLVLGVTSFVLWTLIGLGIGMATRGMVLALLIGVGISYVVDPSVAALFYVEEWHGALNLLPSGATNAMLRVDSPALLASAAPWPWWAGLLMLTGWAAVPASIGLLTTLRRDP